MSEMFMEMKVIIRRVKGGWKVIRWTERKGEVLLATLCGGDMGKRLAIVVAQHAAESLMLDPHEVVLEMNHPETIDGER